MDHIPELSRYERCRICVPQSCPRDCFLREDYRYQQYLQDSMKPDIKVCNHNYLLADASHRLEDRPLLLRSYQALVVDLSLIHIWNHNRDKRCGKTYDPFGKIVRLTADTHNHLVGIG